SSVSRKLDSLMPSGKVNSALVTAVAIALGWVPSGESPAGVEAAGVAAFAPAGSLGDVLSVAGVAGSDGGVSGVSGSVVAGCSAAASPGIGASLAGGVSAVGVSVFEASPG